MEFLWFGIYVLVWTFGITVSLKVMWKGWKLREFFIWKDGMVALFLTLVLGGVVIFISWENSMNAYMGESIPVLAEGLTPVGLVFWRSLGFFMIMISPIVALITVRFFSHEDVNGGNSG